MGWASLLFLEDFDYPGGGYLLNEPTGFPAYQGQVLLFPPNPCKAAGTNRTSVSFGVVALKRLDEWMYIKTDADQDIFKEDIKLSRNEADTICRAVGYTHVDPNSLMSVRKAEETFHYEFDLNFMYETS